jgi:hypothetical protein
VPASRYRQHDRITGPYSTTLQQQVAEEWVRLNQDPTMASLLARWARRCPAMVGMSRPADIVDAIDAGCPQVKDELLLALVELFQSGQQLAGRVALQAMLPKLGGYAFRGSSAELDERFQAVLCEFWEVLIDYPAERRTAKVAANLSMETWHRLTRSARPPEVPLDPQVLSAVVPAAGTSSLTPGLGVDCDLDQLLTWAVQAEVISTPDAELLARVYLDQPEARGTARDVSAGYRDHAVRTGTSAAALRQRAHRAKQRLAAAVRDARAG